MNETRRDLTTLQLEREKDQVLGGINRYRKHREAVSESSTKPGHTLAVRAVERTAEGIRDMQEQVEDGKAGAGKPAAVAPYLSGIEAEAAAYITTRIVIDGMGNRDRLPRCAMKIASLIEEHYQMDELRAEEPALSAAMERKAKKWSTPRSRRFIMRLGAKVGGVRGLEWKDGDKLRLGLKLIEIFIERTGLAQTELVSGGDNRRAYLLRPTDATAQWLDDAHERLAVTSPRFLPMLVKPKQWRDPTSGGYLTLDNKVQFIGGVGAALRDDAYSIEMPAVYDAVNRVQETPWRINHAVYNVMREVWSAGETLGGLPPADDMPLPARPTDIPTDVRIADLPEDMQRRANEYKAQCRIAHEQNAALISKRVALAQCIDMASTCINDDQFYFPHNLDFRGRIYSVVPGINPQGNDTGKALLEFAEGKRLGDSGAYWLSVHIANLFGHDKVSFDDRVKWVIEHGHLLLDSAANPLDGDRFWCEADYPYCALAACFEYAGMLVEGEDYVSHLPIAMDGSCSGIQHFSAMLKDEKGGKAVNLVKLDEPADIYTEVAERAEALIAESGDPDLNCWAGNVSRKIVKRPCMTFAYSVTARGMRDQILDEMRKQAEGDTYLPGVENWNGALLLAPVVHQAIIDTVSRAAEAMDYLKSVSREYFEKLRKVDEEDTTSAIPMNWSTPDGFPVQQRYAKTNGKRFKVNFQGERMDIQLRVETTRADIRKQASAVAPNFVHSLDAAHLRMVVNRMVNEGVTTSFAMIHDSFGTHAGDVDELHHVIRDEFIKLYSDNQLELFGEMQRASAGIELPMLPSDGNLNLEEVRDADFFFA